MNNPDLVKGTQYIYISKYAEMVVNSFMNVYKRNFKDEDRSVFRSYIINLVLESKNKDRNIKFTFGLINSICKNVIENIDSFDELK